MLAAVLALREGPDEAVPACFAPSSSILKTAPWLATIRTSNRCAQHESVRAALEPVLPKTERRKTPAARGKLLRSCLISTS
jgi:hypothetical protein